MCVKSVRQLGSGHFSPYITIERVSFAPYKSHLHFYFRWLHVPRDWRRSAVHSFSYSLVYPVLQYLRISIVSDHACPCMYKFVLSCSTFCFIPHQGRYFYPSIITTTMLCCCHRRTLEIYWRMVSVISQHALIFVTRLLKALGTPVLAIQHRLCHL